MKLILYHNFLSLEGVSSSLEPKAAAVVSKP